MKQQALLKSQMVCLHQPTMTGSENTHAYYPMDLETIVIDDLSNSASIEVTSDQHNLILAKHSEDLASTLYVTDNNNTQPVNGTDSQDEEVYDIGNVSLDDSEGEDNVTPLPVAGQWQKPRSGLQPVIPNTQPIKTSKRKSVPQPATLVYDCDACSKLPFLYYTEFPSHKIAI